MTLPTTTDTSSTPTTSTGSPAAAAGPDGCGCPEFARAGGPGGMSRRGFLAASGLGAAATFALGSSPAEAATQLTFADAGYTGDTLVVLSFRGGFDGLTAVAPVGDPAYYTARPNIAVPQSRGLKLDTRFALHPALAPLLPLYTSGRLAMVHAVGQPNPTRSHFTDMDEMERAAPGSSLRTGWLDRMVGATTTPGPFAATSLASTSSPRSLMGPTVELAMRSLDSFELAGAWDTNEMTRWTKALSALHVGAPAQLATPAEVAIGTVATTTAMTATPYTPAGGAAYPYGALGDALRDAARLIKAGVGLRAVTIDSGNWDMHVNLGRSDGGWMYNQLTEVGKALAAFNADLGAAGDRVTLVTLSEFGRRVAENGSGGVDHGYGNVSFVMGGGVNGGKVYGTWPGLTSDKLLAGDLNATTDYRIVLGEILEKRCGLTASTVLPGLPSTRLGIAKPRS
ncbi:DUF1501 domain-containing protein [Pedococcus aerophilus]|uniref:DUF1501 domain-containing protein n=1 Tax=Pedococcus aerophilus TaxID=436356 RepID=A0ABP6GRV9_9MICO